MDGARTSFRSVVTPTKVSSSTCFSTVSARPTPASAKRASPGTTGRMSLALGVAEDDGRPRQDAFPVRPRDADREVPLELEAAPLRRGRHEPDVDREGRRGHLTLGEEASEEGELVGATGGASRLEHRPRWGRRERDVDGRRERGGERGGEEGERSDSRGLHGRLLEGV